MRATVIITTTGDRGPLLPLSVGSVLRQTVADLEVFVIGDGVSKASRAVIHELAAADSRVRFFDHPKDPRRGERHRHSALQAAQGRIVCYLTDRDLMLPDHVAEMDRLLADHDFGHTLRFRIEPDGGLRFIHTLDINDPRHRAAIRAATHLIPFSFAGHTLEAYRRLPYGWRTTPPQYETDRYMWHQFLEQPDCRTATSTRPTILYFKRGNHPGWPVDRRLEELQRWEALMNDPKWVVKFEDTVHDVAIRKYGYAATPLGTGVRLWLARNAPQFYGLARSIRRAALGGRRRAPRSAGSHIKDVASRSIGMDLVLEAYWVGEPVGPGPGASLLARNDEVMRFDCLVNNAHMHLNMNRARRLGAGSARIYFVPGATRAHMERAAHELVHNTAYALAVNDDRAIRALRPATEQLEEAAEWMVAHWLELARARQLDVGDSDKHAGKLVHRTLERASAGAEVVQSPQSGREP